MTPAIHHSRMKQVFTSKLDASTMRIGIVVSRYHSEITTALLNGAKRTFTQARGKSRNLQVVDAPGAWELTAICGAMAWSCEKDGRPRFDAIVALGCILTGETTHDQYIAQSVTHGLTQLTVETGVPIAFGVLTCQTIEQALARKSKGVEAMRAAIAASAAIRPFAMTAEVGR